MARFEESNALFGAYNNGATEDEVICEWCGKVYPEGVAGNSITRVMFGDKQVLDCCFGEVENAVLQCMPGILPWFQRLLAQNRSNLERYEGMIADLKASLLQTQGSEDH